MANKMLKKTSKKKASSSGFGKDVLKAWQPVAMFGCSLLVFFLVIVPGENLWLWLHNFIFSLFGVCSILWPILIGTVAVLDAMGKSGSNVKLKLWLSVATIIFACSLFYVFLCPENSPNTSNVLADTFDRYRAGEFNGNSGLFGALIGMPCVWAFGVIGARITNIILLFVCLMFLTSATLMDFLDCFQSPQRR